MKDILIEIDRLAADELERANKAHPLFHSDHEGVAVIEEEILEVEENLVMVREAFKLIKKYVYKDTQYMIKEGELIGTLRNSAEFAAAELIQVIAMCDKFVKSQEARYGDSSEDC